MGDFMKHTIPLCDLTMGKRAVIAGLDDTVCMSRRLADMGVVKGNVISMEYKSMGGDPAAYRINNTLLALRLADCKKIAVIPLTEDCYD